MRYVIIGNSAAAVGCVTGIRTLDESSSITIISNEKFHTYSRPLISYWLKGKVTDENMYYRGPDFYRDNRCDVILGVKAVKILSVKKAVVLENNELVEYDRLLVATGSTPFVPPVPGLAGAPNSFTFLSWGDAEKIKNAVAQESKVVILGAGLIGLKAAEGLCGLVGDITVIDLADRVLPSILDTDGSEMIRNHIEAQGVKILLNDSAKSVADGKIELGSGKILPYDALIIAVGVRPNAELAKDAGATVNRGIITDNRMRTSLPEVYAAGDCVESYDVSSGTSKVLALLPNAYMQGETAGINMAGGDTAFDRAIPMNAIGFFGLHVISAGSYDGEIVVEKGENTYRKLFFKDGRLSGYIMIGSVDRAGIYTSLIREQTPLDEVDMDILRSSPKLLIFSKAVRKQKLAGGV
jgi:NAD(P)H-nitrite reductase large subunit